MKVIEEEVAAGAMPKGQKAAIEEVDLKTAYIEAICRFADLDLIAKATSNSRWIRCTAPAAAF